MEPVCFDIMEMIGKEYQNIKETNKNKKIYGEIIEHLDHYFIHYEAYKEYPSGEGCMKSTHSFIREYIKEGDIRIDTQFLEYENLWDTNHYKMICHKHGGQEHYDKWCDEYWFCSDEADE